MHMTILLLGHIIVAVSGLLIATLGVASPSRGKLSTTYGLLGATLASGTVLVIVSGSPLVSACLSGIIYSAIVLVLTFIANRRLAAIRAKSE